MIDAEDDWVWDFWTTHDGRRHHAFFLTAPRSLGEPDLRHLNARVGHATSTDLRQWTRLPDALVPQPAPAYDDVATWTGSVAGQLDGVWWMFTSGQARADDARVQRVGASTSPDLTSWTRTGLVLEADPRWYVLTDHRGDTHWRDPFVVADGAGGWHMYVTAKAGDQARGNGVVGHLVSDDLEHWEVRAPLSEPTGIFDQLEVISLARVDGRWALLFSCLGTEMPGGRLGPGGVWSVPVDGPGASVDIARAVRVTSEQLYVGRVAHHDGRPWFLAFRDRDGSGCFVGGVTDPLPVRWRSDGAGLELHDVPPETPGGWLPGGLPSPQPSCMTR